MTQTFPQPITLEHHFVETNGVNLHVVQAGPADGALVILLHGFPEFWYGWRHQIEFLATRGYRVWAPDQRGYNLSEKPPRRDDYGMDQLSDDVIGLIDAAGREKAYLVGHDWGAAVAWWTAMRTPERLDKLVILNVPHPSVLRKNIATNPRQMLRSWYIGFFQIPLLPEALLAGADAQGAAMLMLRTSNPGSFTDADIAQYTRAWKQPGAMTAMLNWYRSIAQNPPPSPPDRRIHIPTLILWGVNDVALTPQMAQQSAEYCDDVQVITIQEATHWVQHDAKDKVNGYLADFLRPER